MLHDQDDMSNPTVMAEELGHLRHKLSRTYSSLDEHLLDESIEDALLRYLACPEDFDAARGVPLSNYLELWTRSYLDKRLRKQQRCRKHETAAGVSEKKFEEIVSGVRAKRGIYIGRDRNEKEVEEQEEEVKRERVILNAVAARLEPRDQAGIQLLRVGDSHEKWVRHLGIEHAPRKQQQRKIDAEKDRLRKKLRRRVQKMREEGVA